MWFFKKWFSKHIRYWSLDIVRGLLLGIMIFSHSAHFLYTGDNPIISGLASFGNIAAFTGFVFIAGITAYLSYIHESHPQKDVVKRVVKRLVMYILGYYVLGTYILYVTNQLEVNTIVSFLTFTKLLPFTEFIPPLLFLAVLKIVLRKQFYSIAHSFKYTFLVASILFVSGSILAIPPTRGLVADIQALLFGWVGVFSFPLFQYAAVYIFGLWVGNRFWEKPPTKHTDVEILLRHFAVVGFVTSIIAVAIGLSDLQEFSLEVLFWRWPPTPIFMLTGVGFVSALLSIFTSLEHVRKPGRIGNFFALLGQNSFIVFFTSTFLFYFLQRFGIETVNPAVFSIFYIFVLFFSAYLSRFIPLNYQFSLSTYRWSKAHIGNHSTLEKRKADKEEIEALEKMKHLDVVAEFTLFKRRRRVYVGTALLFALVSFLFVKTNLDKYEANEEAIAAVRNLESNFSRSWLVHSVGIIDSQQIIVPVDEEMLTAYPELVVSAHLGETREQYFSISDEGYELAYKVPEDVFGDTTMTINFYLNDQKVKSEIHEVTVSAPVFVTWTIDWEGYDVTTLSFLEAMATISDTHSIPMTQLFNPRIYFAEDISEQRSSFLTNWVKDRRDRFGEEIGLHLHMFPDFVEAAGVSSILEPTWGAGSLASTPGYDVLTSSYGTEDFSKILAFAKETMEQKGLGTPKSYRAAGWFADEENLIALQEQGFLVDSSARTKYTLGNNGAEGHWDVPVTMHPYFPSIENQNSTQEPNLTLLEIPNNGADTFAFGKDELINRFTQNYDGGVKKVKTQVTYLTHPHWFNTDRQNAIDETFSYIDQYKYSNDSGPVVYTTLLGVYEAWKQ